jgi:hypothetical protein
LSNPDGFVVPAPAGIRDIEAAAFPLRRNKSRHGFATPPSTLLFDATALAMTSG